MKNENTQPAQAESHKAWNFVRYLTMLRTISNSGQGISDTAISKLLDINRKTAVRMREEFQNEQILSKEPTEILQNNEKAYSIIDLNKLEKMLSKYSSIHLNKTKSPFFSIKDIGKLSQYTEPENYYLLEYYKFEPFSGKMIVVRKPYSKEKYHRNICPVCPQPAATLREYGYKNAHAYDRRCPKCGYYFLFSGDTIRTTKNIAKLKKILKPEIKKYQDSEMILGSKTLYKNWRKGKKKLQN